MRVLHVIAGAAGGGADALMSDAVLALAEAGVEQSVVTRDDAEARVAAFKRAGLACKTAKFDKKWRQPAKAAIRQAAHKFRPDIVHYWLGRSAQFAPGSLSARAVGWHGDFHRLERFKHCSWHMAASQMIAARIIEEGAPAGRVAVVPAFADSARAEPADRAAAQTPDTAPLVLAFARLHRKKGVDKLIEAVARLPGVYLWIVGEGDSEGQLRDLAKRLDAGARIRLLGRRADRAALLAACDAVALTARLEHPFAQVAAEAWAAGKPLVAADAAGPAAGVTDEVDALLAPRDDAGAWREQLRRVLDDAELAGRLVANGARAYAAGYTRTAFVRASMAFYERARGAAEQGARRKPAA